MEKQIQANSEDDNRFIPAESIKKGEYVYIYDDSKNSFIQHQIKKETIVIKTKFYDNDTTFDVYPHESGLLIGINHGLVNLYKMKSEGGRRTLRKSQKRRGKSQKRR